MLRQTDNLKGKYIYAVLMSRLLLFLFFQIIFALIAGSWIKSEKYWLLSATFTNVISIALLVLLYKNEGKNFLAIFRINRSCFRIDIIIFIGFVIIAGPLIFFPGYFLSLLIWSNPSIPAEMMFTPIESWLVYFMLLAFPLTIAFAELATYFVYIMPRLISRMKFKWMAILLPVLFLSIQHCTLPLIPDFSFILYRALVFLPFALLIGITIYFRPSLFPYIAVLHGLMDLGTVLMFLLEIR